MASAEAMGLQRYERSIQSAINALDDSVKARTVSISSMRNPLPSARRMPAGVYHRAPLPAALAMGVVLYRTRGLVHRFDLRLPPAIGPEVVTIHDLPPIHFNDEGTLPRSAAAGARRAKLVLTPSQFAADEVVEHLGIDPERIRVIANGVDPEFFRTSDDGRAAAALGVTGPYLLHAAGATERKNLPALAEAWQTVAAERPEMRLVLCGPHHARRNELFGALPGALMVGLIGPDRVAALMSSAAAVVIPSVYEGFGLPALEAMAAGAAVVAADRGALPEVCGGAALMVEPDAKSLADGLLDLTSDTTLASEMRARGRQRAASFSWGRSARAHVDAYREALEPS